MRPTKKGIRPSGVEITSAVWAQFVGPNREGVYNHTVERNSVRQAAMS